MTVAALLEEIRSAGLTLDPAPDGIRVSPKGRLTDELRQKIRAHKAELLAALSPPSDDDLDADTASQAVAAEVLEMAAHHDLTAFALKNHADAIRHFRRMALETERLAAMYRQKLADHTEAARKRLPPEHFDSWIQRTTP